MKSAFIIFGNGFTIDFLKKFNEYLGGKDEKPISIDVQNLFKYGEVIGTPWGIHPEFLSYKVCLALCMRWALVQIKVQMKATH